MLIGKRRGAVMSSDDLERALQENLKLRHELASNVTKAEAAAANQRPMSASQRVSRGFHRVGLVLAALGLCWGLYIGLLENPPGQTEGGFTQWVIFGAIIGAVIYGIVRTTGWVIGGFIRM
jgi:hypothetical protein